MKCFRISASLFVVLAATFVSAQRASIFVSSGSPAAKGAPGGWTGLDGSASRAMIDFALNGGPPPITGPRFKFRTTPAGVEGQEIFGFGGEGVPGFAGGQSSVSEPTSGSGNPVYYTVELANSTKDYSERNASGTFDPFDVTYGDLSGLAGGPVDLYFQSALRSSPSTGTFTRAEGNAEFSSRYDYSFYVTDPNEVRTDILSLSFSSETGLDIDFNATAEFELFLLDPLLNGDDPDADPDQRIATGLAIRSQAGAESLLSPLFGPGGTPVQDLEFGVRRHLDITPTGSANDRLFAWHVDTSCAVFTSPVPEPAALVPLAIGALALLRRRRFR